MKLYPKRLLILFSVALNIGFVIMAIVMMVHHPAASHNRSYRAILDIVGQLNLPTGQEQTVVSTIRQFKGMLDKHHQEVKAARGNIIRFLASPGPVDRNQLHRLTEVLESKEKINNEAFERHFLELRNQLGNEKGAQFFTLLLADLEAKGQSPHP